MAFEITVQYITGATLTANVYYEDSGLMKPRAEDVALTEQPDDSGLYVNTTAIAGLTAGDKVIVYDGSDVVGGGEYQPEISSEQIDDVNSQIRDTENTLSSQISTVDGKVDSVSTQITNLDDVTLDEILSALSNGENIRLDYLCARFLNRTTKDPSTITVFDDDDITKIFEQPWSSDHLGNEEVGAAQ